MVKNALRFATQALHAGYDFDPTTHACAVPIYQTASFCFDSTEDAAATFNLQKPGNIYTRLNNPTLDVLEQRLAAIDGGVGALCTASGMSAIFLAVTNILQAGDHLVTCSALYGGTDTLFRVTLKRFGIEVTFIEDFTAENIQKAFRPNTKAVYFETISNPSGYLPDIAAITACAHKAEIPVIVDNTFAPGICRLFEHGVDVIVYSCTKWLGGHGTSIGGAIVDAGTFDWKSARFPEMNEPDEAYHGLVYSDLGASAFIVKARIQGMRNIGPCMSPFNAWQILQGIETLPLRMKGHSENALQLARYLEKHPKVSSVNYTGLTHHVSHATAQKYLTKDCYGSVFGIELKDGVKAAESFIDRLQLACHLANVGDAKTLVIHPWSTTHAQLTESAKRATGLTPGFIRISVGLEDIEDIIADFEQALQ